MARQRAGVPGLVALVVVAALGYVLVAGGDDQVSPAPGRSQPEVAEPARPSGSASGLAQPVAPEPITASSLPFVDVAAAQRAVTDLPVKGRAPLTDYDRAAFGVAWSDTNDNGCDTRNDILRRDLRDTRVADCMVLSGVLDDPYSGQRIRFVRGPVTSLDVQIDHVVALANAWQTGAAYWTPAKRERFANDRRNLLAVRGDLNLQKRDGDAATWLPPRTGFRCTYVAMQVLTKQRYGLWVTPAEKSAMQRILADC